MRQHIAVAVTILLTLTLASCGAGKKDEKGALTDKKIELEKLKKEQAEINTQITVLEKEITALDPSIDMSKAKLVTIETIASDSFNHFIDLQGKIDAQNIAMVSPKGQGGVITGVYVKQGQRVSKGQLILKLDNAIAQQSVVAAQQQIGGIKAQLAQAQSIYERQQNLWKQNIGTEIQVLNAKTNVEAMQSQLRSAEANVRLAQEQANLSNVQAAISGVIDVVNVSVGEFFSAASAGNPASGIRIVNTGDLKLVVQVPENYLAKVKIGSPVRITLPESGNKVIESKITVVGNFIDPVSRTFFIEAKVPQDNAIKPNQIAKAQILDYANTAATTVPVNILQTDDKGKYVMVAVTEKGKLLARKRTVIIGELYNDRLEVKSGLMPGDVIIIDGFQSLYDGQFITTTAN